MSTAKIEIKIVKIKVITTIVTRKFKRSYLIIILIIVTLNNRKT